MAFRTAPRDSDFRIALRCDFSGRWPRAPEPAYSTTCPNQGHTMLAIRSGTGSAHARIVSMFSGGIDREILCWDQRQQITNQEKQKEYIRSSSLQLDRQV